MENSSQKKCIRIGTRGSDLALAQARLFADAVKEKYPETECELKIIVTQGDRETEKELAAFGGKGVFVSAIEDALRAGEIDVAVHSGKDLPMDLADGLMIGAVLEREDPRDVLVVRRDKAEHFVRIGCGSPRRCYQLRKQYPHAEILPIRGNVPTRLEKVRSGAFDATVLAMAGIKRLGITEDDTLQFFPLDPDDMIPAGCQGIIAVEMREGDALYPVISSVSHKGTERIFRMERKFLKENNGGCQEPIGILVTEEGEGYRTRILKAKL